MLNLFKKIATATPNPVSLPAESDIKKVKITEWLPEKHMSQIYNSGLEFAFVSKGKSQATYFATCKDFLQDALYAQIHQTDASIFGFTYSVKSFPPISLDRTRIILVNKSDSSFLSRANNVEDFINQFCKRLRMKPTKVFQISNPPRKYSNGALYLAGSGMWTNSPPLISMYSLFLRVGLGHKPGTDCMSTIEKIISGGIKPYNAYDKNYLASAKKGIDKILELGYRKFFYIDSRKNFPHGTNIGTMHSSGIVNFANKKLKVLKKAKTPDKNVS